MLLSELFGILKKAFDNVMSDSLPTRKIIIQDAMEEYINARASNPHAVTATYTAAVDHLNSHLALDRHELMNIFKDAAKQCGFDASNALVIKLKDPS